MVLLPTPTICTLLLTMVATEVFELAKETGRIELAVASGVMSASP